MRMQWRRLPLGYLYRQTSPGFRSQEGDYNPLERRKEAISWRTHFLGVANVVKVIWFRFRILAARELLSSTKHGYAQTRLACTISRSVMAISSLMNPLAMDLSIRIAVAANRCDAFPGDFCFRQGMHHIHCYELQSTELSGKECKRQKNLFLLSFIFI